MENKIEIYTGENCSNCKALKDYCKQTGIEYVEKPISDKDNMMFLRKNGLMGVPVLAYRKDDTVNLVQGFAASVDALKDL